MPKRFVIAGGGTGGHIFPALSIAEAIQEIDPSAEILFVGAKGRMETRIVPARGYRLEAISIAGFQRKRMAANLTLPFKVGAGLWQAYRLLRRFRPDWVVGTGGYVSFPVGLAARWLEIPLLIQEQNFFPGLTNRWLGRWARYVCVPHQDIAQYFPRAEVIETGNPVRKELLRLPSGAEAKARWGIRPDRLVVGVLGGSLGARPLNEAVLQWAPSMNDVDWLWQTGRHYLAPEVPPHIHPIPFIEEMAFFYAAADIVISRAGAITLAELAITRRPSILVPSPHVAEDHQTHNARFLTDRGAAVLLPEKDLSERLPTLLRPLIADADQRRRLAEKIGKLARPDAAQRIAALML